MGIETPQENISLSGKVIVVELQNSNQNDSLDYPKDFNSRDISKMDTLENHDIENY